MPLIGISVQFDSAVTNIFVHQRFLNHARLDLNRKFVIVRDRTNNLRIPHPLSILLSLSLSSLFNSDFARKKCFLPQLAFVFKRSPWSRCCSNSRPSFVRWIQRFLGSSNCDRQLRCLPTFHARVIAAMREQNEDGTLVFKEVIRASGIVCFWHRADVSCF